MEMPNKFKSIEIQDKEVFHEYLQSDPPMSSELTFTNLFIWRHRYHPRWMEEAGGLLIVLQPDGGVPFGLPPVGPGDKARALRFLAEHLRLLDPEARICRVPEDFVKRFVDPGEFEALEDRDNSDYVYLAEDLINLPGKKYHNKRNHLNRFLKSYSYEYRELDEELVECFLDMQEQWCRIRECKKDLGLLMEDYAVYQALTHFGELDYRGGAILLEGRVEAFTLGERLNENTAVIHIEKANPEVSGIYAAINQFFCKEAWSDATYINREQDLGIEGLRKAKTSYGPHHMVDKYTLVPIS
ncbi:MAG: phosphatidylglycerol lysyltransferase domain-containing protein [Desulfatiglandaceae bacterium]